MGNDTSRAPQHRLLNVEVINTEEGFDRIEKEWDELVEESDCTVFQTHEWQRSWWKHFLNDQNHELYCLVMRDGRRVAGIAPMYRERIRLLGVTMYTRFELIGGGYTDIIWDADYREDVFETLAAHLRSTSRIWDVLNLRYVSATSETPEMVIRHFRRNGLKVFPAVGQPCPQASLPGTWEEYLRHIGQNMRHKIKRKTKALKDISDFQIELVEEPGASVDKAVQQFADVYNRRRRGLGDESWLDSPQNFRFIAEVSEKFARRGWLRIFFLRADSGQVAANLHFHFKKRIYGYLCGVDGPPEVMKYSPGFLLHCSAIKHGISEGMELYDMMFGGHQYKIDSFRSVPLRSWQIEVVSALQSHYYRFVAMKIFDFLKRAILRLGTEYSEVKRQRAAEGLSFFSTLKFAASRFMGLAHILRLRILHAVRGNRMTLEEADEDDS